jgi:tetratricopeptide (TPR) repeat protein
MRLFTAAMCVVLASGCQKQGTASGERASAPPAVAPGGMPEMRVGSALFHLEIGGVYERFQDHKSAIEHLSQAASLAQDAGLRVQACSALAQAKVGAGDRDGAIAALEKARDEAESPKRSAPGTAPGPFAGPVGNDVILRLGQLYVEAGRYEPAERLTKRALASAREPWQREQLERLLLELHRKAGTLEKKLAEAEKALDSATPDEEALRFLTMALGNDALPGPSPMEAPSARPPAVPRTLIRAYERLHELHPEDAQVRQTLQSLLERSGGTEDAVRLVTSVRAVAPMDCAGALDSQAPSPALQAAAEGVRIRLRAGQKERALAEAAKIAGLADREGVAAYVVAAQLDLEQGAADRALQVLQRASREARSREDRRKVTFARERAIQQMGRMAELSMLHEEWKKSDDACLRLAASQREQTPAMMAAGLPAPPMAPVPPPQ